MWRTLEVVTTCDHSVTGQDKHEAQRGGLFFGVEADVVNLVLAAAAVGLVVLGIVAAVLVSGYRRRRTERADELAARRVEEEFRRAFGDKLPSVEAYPRVRPTDAERIADVDRPAKRSNWSGGEVRPQG